MNKLRTDLNLLHVVHAVIAESSVTRAARRLAMTQPAVSNALRRARGLLQDELLVKGPSGMRPTDRALALWPDLDQALNQIANLTREQRFEPETTTLNFRIAVTPSLEGALAPLLAISFAAQAPRATLCFQPHTDPRSIADLEQGRLDCALGMFPSPPETLKVKGVLDDEHVCVLRKGHPAPAPLSLDALIACRHVLVSPSARPRGVVDAWLEMQGRVRDIAVVVNRYEDALAIVAETDLITVIPKQFAESHIGKWGKISPLPVDGQDVLYKLVWHERTDRSPPHRWLRDMITARAQAWARGT